MFVSLVIHHFSHYCLSKLGLCGAERYISLLYGASFLKFGFWKYLPGYLQFFHLWMLQRGALVIQLRV